MTGSPHILFLGNNPEGKHAIPHDLPGTVELGFPGIGGSLSGDVVEYVRIPQQPTTLEAPYSPISQQVEGTLRAQGFPVQRTRDIDGWLAYHAVFVGSIAAALLRVNSSAEALANDRRLLTLMCRSIEEGFAVLKAQHRKGLPRNLALLHQPWFRPLAVRYWAKTMRSPMGELCFAAHTRHAPDEMRKLAAWAYEQAQRSTVRYKHLAELLGSS